MGKKYSGIDVSTYQKSIDWKKVAKKVNFVIIRSGYGNTIQQKDKMFESHIEGAVKAGINKIGVYHFSYAISVQDARDEAQVCLDIIKKYKKNITMPVAFDWEYDSERYCKQQGVKPNKTLCDNMALSFGEVIEKAGYQFMLYSNPDYLSRYFTSSKYKYLWVAQYASKCQISNVAIWQYSSEGKVDGIEGNVDLDYCYSEFTSGTGFVSPLTSDITISISKQTDLRNDAHLKAKKICSVPKGAAIQWLADDNWGWSKIKYNGKTGYVQNSYISGKSGLTKYRIATVTVNGLNVRKTDSLKGNNIITVLNNGDKFEIICINPNGWVQSNIKGSDCYITYNKNYYTIGGKRV